MTEPPGSPGHFEPPQPSERLGASEPPAPSPAPRTTARRLSPLTPLVRGSVLAVAVAFSAVDDLVAGRLGPLALTLLLVLVAGGAYGWLAWWRTRFWLAEDELRIDTGVLQRQSRRIRIDRVQGVDIVQPLLARLFGLAEVRLDTPGGAREGSLAYLRLGEAQELRGLLLARRAAVRVAAGSLAATGGDRPDPADVGPPRAVPEPEPEHEIARLDLGTLLLSLLLSTGTVVLVVGVAATTVAVVATSGAALAPLAPALVGFLVLQARRLSAYYGFTVSRTERGLQVRRGLLELTAQSIAIPRVQGVVVSEPAMWRPLGWARLDVALAGEAGSPDSDGGPSATTVMPVAPRGLVLWLAEQLLTAPADVDAVRLTGVPRGGRLLDPVTGRFLAAGLDEELAVAREGWLTRRTHVVRHARVQSVRLVQGPLQRRLGVADVVLDSPPGPVRVRMRHRAAVEARGLLEQERDLARRARSATSRVRAWVRE